VAQKVYTLELRIPALPFAKFPLLPSQYIKEFLADYNANKTENTKVIGVHFDQYGKSQKTVGIEIKLTEEDNMIIVESISNDRF
jgi:hypothetical protein